MRSYPRKGLRILDFDTECRPLSFMGKDFNTKEITAIACSWIGQDKVHCWALGEVEPEDILTNFRRLYDQSDVVSGHYIRRFDLPLINGAMMELGMPPLGPKLTSDTCIDLKKQHGISRSQENLAAMLELAEDKYGMNQVRWREANRLTPEGIKLTKKRVMMDVRQHKELRDKLLELRYLGPPKPWKP